jgi:Flp pilus assembly protein TadG
MAAIRRGCPAPEVRQAGSAKGRGVLGCERGAELVEFALIFPTLLLVMLGIIDLGFMFQRYEVLTNAAREGARVAILPNYTNADVQARVTQYLTAAGLTDAPTPTVGPVQTITVGGTCITVRPVTAIYNHEYLFVGPILTLLGGASLGTRELRATSAMRNETAAESCS